MAKRIILNHWPHNGGLYSSADLSVRVGDVVEVPDEAAARLTLSFGGCFSVVPSTRMGTGDALRAAGLSDKVIGALEVAGMVGDYLLAADEDALRSVKGIGKASAAKVLEALAPLRG